MSGYGKTGDHDHGHRYQHFLGYLLDTLIADRFAAGSVAALQSVQATGRTVVCPVVFAELASYFARRPDAPSGAAQSFLTAVGVERDAFEARALVQAGEAWAAYSRNRARGLTCAACGKPWRPKCPECHAVPTLRQHFMADFLIGAHASCQADALLTRDLGYYRMYFEDLRLVEPRHTD